MHECCENKDHDKKIEKKPGKMNVMFVFFVVFLVVASGVTGYILINKQKTQSFGAQQTVKLNAPASKITVYKSETCGCCDGYALHLDKNGLDVNIIEVDDISPIKEKYKIPPNMQSCHTSVIGDYFVEGHVPVEAIRKLMQEKPDISGIGLAGMPSASPGMPGTKQGPFKIYSIAKDGSVKEFMSL